MDVWLQNEGGQDMSVGGAFRVNGNYSSTYGRYSVRFKADSAMPGYGGVFQLWPSSQVWAEGEMDFPEGSYEGSLNLYHHRVGSNLEQNYPHNWVFQTASHTGGDVPTHVQGHVYIDWVVAYSR
jgi:hypothetical protein